MPKCTTCGWELCYVRGAAPGMDNELKCPTCMSDKLRVVLDILRWSDRPYAKNSAIATQNQCL